MAQHVRQAAPGELVHGSRDEPGTPELRGDDRLALCLRDRREVVVAGGVEEVDVRVPGLHCLEHRLALCGVVDGAHVRAGDDPRPAAARVHLDDHVDEGEEHRREEVREHLVGRAVETAGEGAVEVRAGRPEARVRLRRSGRDGRDDDDPPRHLRRVDLGEEPAGGDLALVLVAVGAGRDEHRRAGAVRDRRDRDRDVPVVRPCRRQPELADLLAAVGREVDRARDRMAHARDARYRVTARSVASSSRSTSSSVCAYEKWLRFRFSGSSKMPSFISSRR